MNLSRQKYSLPSLMIAVGALSLPVSINVYAADAAAKTQADLLSAIPKSKLSLSDGIRQATHAGETALSAKFEFDDAGKLSLSVYVAGKGTSVAADSNVLKELAGDPTGNKWTPQTEVFADAPHVARSAQQLTLVAIGHTDLIKVIDRAQREHGGKVYAITPVMVKDVPKIAVSIINAGRSTDYTYDLMK